MRCNHFKRFRSKGYGITLVAETEKGIRYAVDVTSEQPRSPAESSEQSRTMETAEEMGERAALLLLEEIYRVLYSIFPRKMYFTCFGTAR